jgi:hypothetical protein
MASCGMVCLPCFKKIGEGVKQYEDLALATFDPIIFVLLEGKI